MTVLHGEGEGRPGPKPHPARRLADAAIDYSAAVEAEGDTTAEWDRLRKAALAYQDGPRLRGRPETTDTRTA